MKWRKIRKVLGTAASVVDSHKARTTPKIDWTVMLRRRMWNSMAHFASTVEDTVLTPPGGAVEIGVGTGLTRIEGLAGERIVNDDIDIARDRTIGEGVMTTDQSLGLTHIAENEVGVKTEVTHHEGETTTDDMTKLANIGRRETTTTIAMMIGDDDKTFMPWSSVVLNRWTGQLFQRLIAEANLQHGVEQNRGSCLPGTHYLDYILVRDYMSKTDPLRHMLCTRPPYQCILERLL